MRLDRSEATRAWGLSLPKNEKQLMGTFRDEVTVKLGEEGYQRPSEDDIRKHHVLLPPNPHHTL